ncbi:MAG TPA: hypothetical protein VNI77_05835 [Nitrososphaera sp.]|nr:hypothetical protein [Nitrososphaera sp.]
MNYSRQSPAQRIIGSSSRPLAGYVLVSVGVILAAGGGSWDINNHLLNKPETFFSPPHALLYTGVGAVVAGAATLFSTSRQAGFISRPIKLVIIGVIMLVLAGPVDFAWHSAFGLDGLMSPPHFVLASGMAVSSISALVGMVHHGNIVFREFRLARPLILVGILPLWLSLSGIIDMFSLPFSETDHFNFNPHPVLGVAVATLAYPAMMSALAFASSSLSGRRFGMVTAVAGAFIVAGILSSIVPNDALISTIPFYLVNIIPFIAADALLSFSRSKISLYAAGAIVGVTFFTLYYPLIIYTYGIVLGQEQIWPSTIGLAYFDMISTVMPLVVAPAAAMGIIGAAAADSLLAKNKDM